MAADAVDNLKSILADKIKTLPADDQSIKTLREIEDLLRDVNAGGFKGILKKDLQSVDDPAVTAAQKEIAMYIMNIDGSLEERQELFDMWRSDKIVNKDVLFSGDDVGFDEIFNGYGNNTYVTELVDTLMRVNSTGHGKGEFALSVFSKGINKPVGSKGDLIAHYGGKLLHVEVKTSDEGATTVDDEGNEKVGKPSSARFGDQEVTVSDEWYVHAKDLNNFVQGKEQYAKRKGIKMAIPPFGMNISKAIEIYQKLQPDLQAEFHNKLSATVKSIFNKETKFAKRTDYTKRLNKNVQQIVDAIEIGNEENAVQAYAQATLNYYLSMKKDDGILYVDLVNKMTIWYTSAEDLESRGLRLHASTISLTGISDPKRSAFPQIFIKPTTKGGNRAISSLKKIAKGKNPISRPEFIEHLSQWIMQLANDRKVNNRRVLDRITKSTYALLAAGTPVDQILPSLEQQFPELKIPVARTFARQQARQVSAQQDPAASAQAAQQQNQAQFQQDPAALAQTAQQQDQTQFQQN